MVKNRTAWQNSETDSSILKIICQIYEWERITNKWRKQYYKQLKLIKLKWNKKLSKEWFSKLKYDRKKSQKQRL